MSKQRSKRRIMGEINVVPYIDVMLVLLVIFMVTAPMLQQGVEIDLPVAAAEPVDETPEEPLIVEINKNGEFFMSLADDPDQPIPAGELATKVAAIIKYKPQTNVLVRGDKNVPYGKVVRLMSHLKTAGVPKVGLMTQPPPDQPSGAQ